MPDDRFPVTWSGRTATVVVPVELDLTIADGLREALLDVLNAGALGLVVDMTATTFCDSAGITAITRAVRRAAATDATMRLAVSEAAACAVTRGPCTAKLRLWASGPRVFWETHGDGLADRGPGGPGRPDEAEALRRRLLRQLCDYACVESGPHGVTVLASIGVI